MKSRINKFQKIVNTGTLEIKDPEKVKRIRLSNIMALTVFSTGTPFAILFYLFGSPLSGVVLAIYICTFLLVFQLNKRKKYLLARIILVVIMNLAVIHYSFWYGEGAGLHRMLIPFACVPFLVFNRKNKLIITASTSISIIGFLLIDFISFEPFLKLSLLNQAVIYHSITCIALTWIVLEMFYLSNQNHKALVSLSQIRKAEITIIVNAQEQERLRIARDLHDSLGQLLSAAKVNLERADNREESPISDSIKIIDQSVEEMRNVAFNLMPRTLDNKGLFPALEELIDRTRLTCGFELDFQVHGINQNKLAKEYQYNIYRIVQEALANIIKHSGAKDVSIQLIGSKKVLTITIVDDGIGFDSKALHQNGMGLQNITARVQWMDGKFIIDSGPTIGTTLIIEINLLST